MRLQFGQFGVGGDYGASFTTAGAAPSHSEPQAHAFQQQANNFVSTSYGSQPSHHAAQTGQQPQQQQGDQLGSSLQAGQGASDPFKSGDLSSAGQQQAPQSHHAQAPQQGQQAGGSQQQPGGQQQQAGGQRSDIGASFSQRPSGGEQQPGGQAAAPRSAQYSSGYGDLSGGYGQQYGQQYGGAFAQGQYDAFGGGGLGGGGGDKRSSFDTGSYGFQSNLGGGYGQPQAAKPADLQSAQSAGSGFGQGSDVGAAGATAAGGHAQAPPLQQGAYGPPGMGGYGYGPQAGGYGYQGYNLAPPNYYMHPSANAYQGGGYGAPQQQQQGGYAPVRPKQQPQQPQQQYSGYGSQGSGYGGIKDAAAGAGAQPVPEANPYSGATAAYQMQGQYSGYGVPQRQQQSNYGGFGGYNAGGYGGGYGQMQGGQAPNGDSFKMQ